MYSIQGDYTGKIEQFTSTTIIPTKEPDSETTKKVKKMYPKCNVMITKLIEANFVPGALKSIQSEEEFTKELRKIDDEMGKFRHTASKEEMEQAIKDGCSNITSLIAMGNFALYTLDENDKKAKTEDQINDVFAKKKKLLSDTKKYGGPIKTCDLANKIEDFWLKEMDRFKKESTKWKSKQEMNLAEQQSVNIVGDFMRKNNCEDLNHILTRSVHSGKELPEYLDCVKEKINLKHKKMNELVNLMNEKRDLLEEQAKKRKKEEEEKRIKEEKEAAEKLLHQQIAGGVGIVVFLFLIYYFFLKKK